MGPGSAQCLRFAVAFALRVTYGTQTVCIALISADGIQQRTETPLRGQPFKWLHLVPFRPVCAAPPASPRAADGLQALSFLTGKGYYTLAPRWGGRLSQAPPATIRLVVGNGVSDPDHVRDRGGHRDVYRGALEGKAGRLPFAKHDGHPPQPLFSSRARSVSARFFASLPAALPLVFVMRGSLCRLRRSKKLPRRGRTRLRQDGCAFGGATAFRRC
ncbi:regulator of sigma E protease [Trypanosoma cruzi]|nr:regulator of sigma E protease [Trypanosoma cruzi]